jgi:uncharacterized protein
MGIFICVVCTADMIDESLKAAHLWAVDHGITKTYVNDVIEGVNAYLRYLINIGAILGDSCWADPDLNSEDQIIQGKIYFNFDFTPVYPAEHIIFCSHKVVENIIEANFGITYYNPILPAGILVELPEVKQPTEKQKVELWD